MITLTRKLKTDAEAQRSGSTPNRRVSVRDKLLVKEVQEMEQMLPTTCKVKFEDPHCLHEFSLIVSPDEGYWKGGKFVFRVIISEEYNMANVKNAKSISSNMENYTKGKNVEQEWTKETVPIPNLPENFTWMHVKGGSKMCNLLEYALKAFKETGAVLWTGCGPAVVKTVSCAEIMKKRFKGLHQINKICYTKYQAPNVKNPFWSNSASHSKRTGALKKQRQERRIDSQSFEDLGLRSNNNRQKKGGGGSAGGSFNRRQGSTKTQAPAADN
ncbi:hypothetical protein LSTR_LSTR010163 [Laodelphax striatellus]|uniref:DNA/RNA-binding protein Alba-like domain-containing protein n=1 Tax=Laodelphax striatellus TaxID=195883 RepID=A0A482WJ06_LAOST|nr:hypothetical protein LSTR_LSTR010163 [Laodelphax striatellus]